MGSVVEVRFRCDHPGCEAVRRSYPKCGTFNSHINAEKAGWSWTQIDNGLDGTDMRLYTKWFCPDHPFGKHSLSRRKGGYMGK